MAVLTFTFSAAAGSEVQTVTLDGVEYRLRVRWSAPLASWYLDLYTAAGEPMQLGRRLSPGYAPLTALNRPPGFFIVDGPEDGPQSDLAGPLRLLYLEATP